MADQKTRTDTPAMQMQESGMPQGQAPAVRRPPPPKPMTAVERARAAAQEAQGNMLADVEANRTEIEKFLGAFGIDYEFFVAGLRVFLMKQQRDQPDFFLDVNPSSFMEALFRVAMNGCIPDGKEAAIAVYKGVATPMFMRDGFVKVLWRTGMIKSINDQTVTVHEYETGRFDYEEGDQGYITHKMDLMRKDADPVVAAYCVIELVTGGIMREVVPKDELDKIAAMSRSPARRAWQHQMHRKAAIRRIMGKMPRDKHIARLLADDELNYDLKLGGPAAEGDGGPPPRDALFSNKPIRRKKKARPEAEAETPAPEVDLEVERQRAAQEEHDEDVAQRQAETPQPDDDDHPYILQAVITTKNGLQQFPPAQAEFWFGDISQKMKTLPSDQLGAFWRTNRPHIEDAGRNGYTEYAMKLMALAKDLGLVEAPRGE